MMTINKHKEFEKEEKIPKLEEEEKDGVVISQESSDSPMAIHLDEQAEELYKGLKKVLEGRAVISDAACKKLISILQAIYRA